MNVDDDMQYINNESFHLSGLTRKLTDSMFAFIIALNATALVTTINALSSNKSVTGVLLLAALSFTVGLLWTLAIVLYSVFLINRIQSYWQELVRSYLSRQIDIKEVYKRYRAMDIAFGTPI